jgi:fermentation-respiration switch protein FrsA (DUF1100 family)
MTPSDLLVHFKADNVSELARTLERPISTVHSWFQDERIPMGVQYELQVRTQGALRATE